MSVVGQKRTTRPTRKHAYAIRLGIGRIFRMVVEQRDGGRRSVENLPAGENGSDREACGRRKSELPRGKISCRARISRYYFSNYLY
jgi:hypothetical protein